jgi:SAM-dependent methyltransferase
MTQMNEIVQTGSASLKQPDYWWYRARSEMLRTVLRPYVGTPTRLLDVGSADGPSVEWMSGDHRRVTIDVDPRGLRPGEGICASALALPFPDATFDVVGAFDVLEHCEPEDVALNELARVLTPGGRLLLSVPAYQWAWTDHDVQAGHYRRYTRPRLLKAVEASGFTVDRATYGFSGVFPFFAAERVVRRLRKPAPRNDKSLPTVSPAMDRILMGLTRVELRLLRSRDLPFGSSVFLAASKPEHVAGRDGP